MYWCLLFTCVCVNISKSMCLLVWCLLSNWYGYGIGVYNTYMYEVDWWRIFLNWRLFIGWNPYIYWFFAVQLAIHQELFKLYDTIAKKFSQSKKVWIAFGLAKLRQGDIEATRAVLKRSLKALPRRKRMRAKWKYKFAFNWQFGPLFVYFVTFNGNVPPPCNMSLFHPTPCLALVGQIGICSCDFYCNVINPPPPPSSSCSQFTQHPVVFLDGNIFLLVSLFNFAHTIYIPMGPPRSSRCSQFTQHPVVFPRCQI